MPWVAGTDAGIPEPGLLQRCGQIQGEVVLNERLCALEQRGHRRRQALQHRGAGVLVHHQQNTTGPQQSGRFGQDSTGRPLGELMATVLGGIGPKGIAFARYSLDYHVLRNHLHTLHEWGEDRARSAMPDYARSIVDRYVREDAQFQAVREAVLAKGRKKREGRP